MAKNVSFTVPDISPKTWFYIKIVGYITAAILLIWVIVSLVRYIKGVFGLEEPKRFEWTPTEFTAEGGNVGLDLDIEYYVSRLTEVLNKFMLDGSIRCQIYKQLMRELNDNEFIAVVNAYAQTNETTLRSSIESTWSSCSIFSQRYDDQVIERMDRLQING